MLKALRKFDNKIETIEGFKINEDLIILNNASDISNLTWMRQKFHH